jgi:hypothetical protein
MSKFLMTAQEALLKIKAMFAEAAEAPVEAPAVASFAEYVLASGAKVMIDKLEVGGKVSLVDDLGNESPAPAGEHMLADGTKIVLDEASTILEIVAPEVEVPEVEVPEAPSEIELMKKKVAEMEAQLEDLKKDKKGMEVKMSESADKFTKAITELTDVVIELSKAPSAQPTSTPKEAFNKHIESKSDKVSRFLNMYAKK